MPNCPVCDHNSYSLKEIIWDELASAWELSAAERQLIDIQQGLRCDGCKCNLRVLTLAHAILFELKLPAPFHSAVELNLKLRSKRILEINTAGLLHPYLKRLPRHMLACYPEVDMEKMHYEQDTWDIVIHSDTLEHIKNPVTALSECRRVLRPGGTLFYTVPILPRRISRRCDERPPSFHGSPDDNKTDYRVWTEYGGDAWAEAMEAGFTNVRLHSLLYPESIAISATKAFGNSRSKYGAAMTSVASALRLARRAYMKATLKGKSWLRLT